MYQVKLEKFEGPLDLLLQLIEKEEVDVCEISLAAVASQFLDYLKQIEKIDPTHLADFLVVAATLILIKSRALLPYLSLPEEEENIEELKNKLLNYQKLKEIARILKIAALNKEISFSQAPYWEIKTTFYPPENFKMEELYLFAKKLITDYPFERKLSKRQIKKVILLEQKINDLRLHIEQYLKTNLSALVKNKNSKLEIILTFLAILQLTKENFIILKQERSFSEIEIEKINNPQS